MSLQAKIPRISCIIAVYNGQAYLREAIDSLLGQTYPETEVVVVNDGSTDGTADVIASYGERIRAMEQSNAGVSIARNRGVAASTGDLVSFLDADDRADARKFALQAAAFEADANLDLCDCRMSNFWSPELSPEVCASDARYAQTFWREPLPGHLSTWMFRRGLWDRVGEFSEKLHFAEDVDWFSRARDLNIKRLTLAEILSHRRLHPGNVTAQRTAEQGRSLAVALRAHLARARKRTIA